MASGSGAGAAKVRPPGASRTASSDVEVSHAFGAYEALAEHYDAFTAHHDHDDWTATVERLARRHGLAGSRMLDVACGTGNSFLPFLDRGFAVTACDISPAMVALAASKARGRAALSVQDMRCLPELGSFDLVCCLDDALNYLLRTSELDAAVSGLARNVVPGGIVAFDVNTLASYRTFFADLTVTQSAGCVVIWDGHATADHAAGERASATVELLQRTDDGAWTRRRSAHHQRHHPRAVVEAALRRAGLHCVAVYGMRLDGSVTDFLSEAENSKAVYIARRGAPDEERR